MSVRILAFLCLLFCHVPASWGWGSWAHKQINKHAVFTLPSDMFLFYKSHLQHITEYAINPDRRRYVVVGEDAHHYIDLEHYDRMMPQGVPCRWSHAKRVYAEDVLAVHGTLPWHILHVKHALTDAFRRRDLQKIIKLSADIGHYIADAHVPLHTSENYDGQATGQEGIHGLWETRLPELFSDSYQFFTGKAEYLSDPQQCAWGAVRTAHEMVDAVLSVERKLSEGFPSDKKYSFEQRGGTLQKVYAFAYAQAYHTLLDGQVERQMNAAVKMTGDFWYTCWVDAGQPDLIALLQLPLERDESCEEVSDHKRLRVRDCGE